MTRYFQWICGTFFCLIIGTAAVKGKDIAIKKTPGKFQSTEINQLNTTYTLHNINNWSYWLQWNGITGRNPQTGIAGGFFPQGITTAIFNDGFVWGGIVNDPNSEFPLRVGGSSYVSGSTPGYIDASGNPVGPEADPRVRIYRIRKDYLTFSDVELTLEAAALLNIPISAVTPQDIAAIREQYARDWEEWPIELGAPFNDLNQNGIYEPGFGETPGVANADQVTWFVMHDLDTTAMSDFTGSPPLKLEIQHTSWAYKSGGPFGNTIYRRLRLSNKSSFLIDSMYIAVWPETDVGNFRDDVVGCDSLLNLGFAYNGSAIDTEFESAGIPPAAVGYLLLQGPVVPSPSDTALFDFHTILDYKNLPLSSFSFNAAGDVIPDPIIGDYDGTLMWYNWMRGFIPYNNVDNPLPYRHGTGILAGRPTKFPLNGDPYDAIVNGNSDLDIDGMPPGTTGPSNRTFIVSSGAFSLQPGGVQEVVFALTGAIDGLDVSNPLAYLNAVNVLKEQSKVLKKFYNNGLMPPQISSRLTHPDAQASELAVQINLASFNNVSGVQLQFFPLFGSEPGIDMMLFDDGLHNDSLANDNIWGNQLSIVNRKYPYRGDLVVESTMGATTIPAMLSEVMLRPQPELLNFRILTENGQQDSSINHNETVYLTFDIYNPDGVNDISSLNINEETFPGSISPGETVFNPSFFIAVTGPAEGDSINFPMQISFDKHKKLKLKTFPVTPWQPPAIWGDTLAVVSEVGVTTSVFPIIADPALLNGHLYQIDFTEVSDSIFGDFLTWRLTDQTDGAIKIDNARVANSLHFIHPVVDGIQFQVNEIIRNFTNFEVIANAAGPLIPPDGAADNSQGFPGIGRPADRQQIGPGKWLIHSGNTNIPSPQFPPEAPPGSYLFFRKSVSRNGGNWPQIIPYDFELRFTGSSIAWDVFGSGQFIEAPFELWNIGIATPGDPSDDYRMFPIMIDGNGDGQWNFDGTDHTVSDLTDDPQTDWIYWYNPTTISANEPPGEEGYLAIEDSIENGTYTGSVGVEVLARMVLVNWNGGDVNAPNFPNNINQQMPEEGTIFRITTAKPNKDGDILLVQSPLPVGIAGENIPQAFYLDQNYPNPFNPETQIRFGLAQSVITKLNIYNVLGQKVKTLVNKKLSAGQYTFRWDAKNEAGVRAASGIYFYRLTAGNFVESKKMVLLR